MAYKEYKSSLSRLVSTKDNVPTTTSGQNYSERNGQGGGG